MFAGKSLLVVFSLCPIKTWMAPNKNTKNSILPWYHDTTQKHLGLIFNVNCSVLICSHSPPTIMLGFQEVPVRIENSARKNSNKFLHFSFINKSSWINQKLTEPPRSQYKKIIKTGILTIHLHFCHCEWVHGSPPSPPPLAPSGGCVHPPPTGKSRSWGTFFGEKKSSNKEWHKNLRYDTPLKTNMSPKKGLFQ